MHFFSFFAGKDGAKVTTVVATPGQGSDRVQEVSYTDTRVIGNGSFGVVFQAKLIETNELVAIKKVLQDRRFKVRTTKFSRIRIEKSNKFRKKIDRFVENDILVVGAGYHESIWIHLVFNLCTHLRELDGSGQPQQCV